MTNAEIKLVKFLIQKSGIDYCQQCIHCEKPTCGSYIPNCEDEDKEFSGECDMEYCIEGMVKYFEKQT